MTARVWNEGDPEPKDRPAVVDDDGITWAWLDSNDEDYFEWTRLKMTHIRGRDGRPGAVLGFSTALDWWEVTGYGPLREATADEAEQITVSYVDSPQEAR